MDYQNVKDPSQPVKILLGLVVGVAVVLLGVLALNTLGEIRDNLNNLKPSVVLGSGEAISTNAVHSSSTVGSTVVELFTPNRSATRRTISHLGGAPLRFICANTSTNFTSSTQSGEVLYSSTTKDMTLEQGNLCVASVYIVAVSSTAVVDTSEN